MVNWLKCFYFLTNNWLNDKDIWYDENDICRIQSTTQQHWCLYFCWLYAPHWLLGSGEEFNNYCFLLSKKVRDKTVLTIDFLPFLHLSVILNIPSIHIFYIMCVSSIFIAVVLCLYSKSSVVVVNNFFLSRRILFSMQK